MKHDSGFLVARVSTVAQQLRQSREALKLDIYQVAEATKIKSDHIRALEEGNYNAFSAPIYIRGFVRAYALVVKLPVPKILADLDEELSQTKKFREPPSLLPNKRTPLDWIMLQFSKLNLKWFGLAVGLLLLLLIVVASYSAWRRHKTTDPLAGLGPGLYRPPAGQSGEYLPLPTNAVPTRP